MKKFIYLITLLLFASFAVSCDEDTTTINITTPESITISDEATSIARFNSIPTKGWIGDLSFESTEDWSIETSAWLSATPSSGDTTLKKVSITISENEGENSRIGKIALSTSTTVKEIIVLQIGKKVIVLDEKTVFDVTASNVENIEVNISSNFDFLVEMHKINWIKEVTPTAKGLTSQTREFEIESNESEEPRSGKILFKSYDGKTIEYVTVNQEGQEPKKPETKKLSVMVWNIWNNHSTEWYGEEGSKGVLGLIKKSNPDVLLLIETYGKSDEVLATLGYEHRLSDLHGDNLSLYSRYPITQEYKYERDYRYMRDGAEHSSTLTTFNFAGVEIDMDGKKVRILNTWLSSGPTSSGVPVEKTPDEILIWDNYYGRNECLEKIVETIQPLINEADEIPIVMGGDFNSHSHLDWIFATKDMYDHGGRVVNWEISNIMMRAGFKDSFREINPDPTKNLGSTWMYQEALEFPDDRVIGRFDRIDYIYYQGKDLKAIASDTYYSEMGTNLSYMGRDYFFGSDHGFVLSSFEIAD